MNQDSSEYLAIIERVKPGQTLEYYNDLYLDMLKFIEENVNGEGDKLRYSVYYEIVWKCQTLDKNRRKNDIV